MQSSFFDQENRLAQLEKPGDPLPRLESIVDWNDFKPLLKKVHQKKRKTNAGRKPYDTILMFKMLVLQSLYNLSDDQAEFQVRDRLSFQRFLALSPEGKVPDAKTLWLFRGQLSRHGLVEEFLKPLIASFGTPVLSPRVGRSLMPVW